MVIFIFQTVWLFIDDLAGKDLDIWIIGKFLFYLMPNLTEKVLPLTVLLSSILTFGSFAENYEFAAMKASGISLQKAMRSLIVFTLLLGVFTFFFANSVIPTSEQKIYNMRSNIGKIKPAAVIVEGAFSDIEGTDMNMKVEKKSGDNDQFLEDIIIHQKSKKNKINTTIIKAKKGELRSSEESDIIQLILYDGQYYEERLSKKKNDQLKHPFNRSDFKEYVKNIDISSLGNRDIEKESDVTTDKMKNISRLMRDIDSLKINNLKKITAFSKSISSRVGSFPIIKVDSAKIKQKKNTVEKELEKASNQEEIKKTIKKDTLNKNKNKKLEEELILKKDSINNVADFINVVPQWQKRQFLTNAKSSVTNILNTIRGKKKELNKRYEIHNRHILSLHKKYALAFSCIILFFVGAPLGAIIRKGGLGKPMVIAIVLFLTYYFIGVFAENYAKKGEFHPIFGAWLSTLIMLPLSIYLTKRATADLGIGSVFGAFRKAKSNSNYLKDLENSLSVTNSFSSEKMDLLQKSLTSVSQFANGFGYEKASEFMEIHERNLKDLISLGKDEKYEIVNRQLANYPIIRKEEVTFYIKRRKKAVSFWEFIINNWFYITIINFIKTKGGTYNSIDKKIKEIGKLNDSLVQILSYKK